MYTRPLDTLLVTFGVALVLQQLARDVFGAPNVDVRAPAWLSGAVDILGVGIPKTRLFILALAVARASSALSLAAQAHARSAGASAPPCRTATWPRRRASRRGPTDRLTFFVGSGVAGVAGVALTLLGSVGPTLGTNYIVDAFLVVVVGGIGQLKGAVIAAFALGLLQAGFEYSTTASIAKVLLFVVIVAFLQVRPQGLVSVRTRSLA